GERQLIGGQGAGHGRRLGEGEHGGYPARCGACAQGGAVALTNRGAYARPRHNRTENALIANMRNDFKYPVVEQPCGYSPLCPPPRAAGPRRTIAHCWAMAAVLDAGATTIPKGTAAA